jgi:hypothetical protein
MIVITRDTPQVFGGKTFLLTKEETDAMNTVASAITDNRSPLTKLLLAHDVQVNENASKEELLDAFTHAFKTKEQFRTDFAKMNVKKFSNADGDEPATTDGNQAPAGGGYLGLINGIIGGVGGILGMFQKPDTTGAQLNYNQQILQLAAQKEAARKRNNTIAIIAVIVVVALIAFGTVYYAKKKKAI